MVGVFPHGSLWNQVLARRPASGTPVAREWSVAARQDDTDARRCPRQRVSWLVNVGAGRRQFQGRTRDISASGVKILVKERPPLGTEVSLSLRPPGRRALETRAIVWRLDAEGLACMFVGTQRPDFIEAVTPPRAVLAARRSQPSEGPRPTPAPRPVQPTPSGTVLLAATDIGLRALVQEALRDHGFTVLDAGPQPLLALRLAEEHRGTVDLILVEADLRLINEEPLVKRLAPLLPSARLLLLSSGPTAVPAGSGARSLHTPCSASELMAHVRQVLES
jgi:hypothetical protein